MQFNISQTSNGKATSETIGYTTTSPSSGIYNVTMADISNSTTVNFIFLVDANNNTVLSASSAGYTLPQSYAKSSFDEIMSVFGLNEYFSGEIQVFTDPAYFTNQGTQTMTFGTVSFPVTTWVANSPNEAISYCGVSATITAYTLQTGTPPGTSLLFITYLHFAGTANSGSEDVTFQLTSMSVRS